MVISQQNSPSMYNMQRTQPHSDGMGFVYPFIILHYFESVYGEVLSLRPLRRLTAPCNSMRFDVGSKP